MSHCPQCNKLMRGICRYCQPQEYIDMQGKAIAELVNETKPQRQWVGLTNEEHMILYTKADSGLHDWAKAIEAKLKEKNT